MKTPEAHPSLGNLLASPVAVPRWWTSRAEQIQGLLRTGLRRGQLQHLATSSGGRPVCAAVYGQAEPELRGSANFNSALGAGRPDAYFRRGPGVRRRPVLMVVAGVHGQEFEGMIGALSLITLLETGRDLMGSEAPSLLEALLRLRLIIVPLANPDGRERVPYEGWVGLPQDEMTRLGQGTRRDGSSYGWRPSKEVHPMRGDVGFLGGYFDDAGVNLMHDEWFAPLSPVTRALLELARDEGPDLLLNLHSHNFPPVVLPSAYVPVSTKLELARFSERFCGKLEEAGIRHGGVPSVAEDGPAGVVPPALNLTGMFFHAGAALPLTFESPHGLLGLEQEFGYGTILRIHHLLFEAAAEHLLATNAPDTPDKSLSGG